MRASAKTKFLLFACGSAFFHASVFAAEPAPQKNPPPQVSGKAPQDTIVGTTPLSITGTVPATPKTTGAAVTSPPTVKGPPPPTPPFPLVDMFSIEQNPGQGILEYSQGQTVEKVDLGIVTGQYAMGMVFGPASLPDQVGREFKDHEVIQIAFGTMRSKISNQVPQFGSATLLTKKIPRHRTTYPLTLPDSYGGGPKESAMLLFTSPATLSEQSDEEKLKNTYFAQTGTITFTPKGKLRKVEVPGQGQKLAFNMVLMEVEFDAKLSTPFNAQENTLKGTVQFPIYWPEGHAGETLAKKLAKESFAATSTLQVPEELIERQVTEEKPDKKRKRKQRLIPTAR